MSETKLGKRPLRKGCPAPAELVARRQAAEASMARRPLADDVEITEMNAKDVRLLECSPPAEARTGAVVVYHHGGGYRLGSADMYRSFGSHLASVCGASVVLVDYRLAPEDPFPAALTDAAAAYLWVLRSTPAKHVVLAGDSAGGGLAAAVLLDAAKRGLPMPAGAVLLSPWVDLRNTAHSFATRAETDDLFSRAAAQEASEWYLSGHPATDPLVSPLLGDWMGMPPTLIHVSDAEVLYDDAARLAATALTAGVDVRYKPFSGVPHIWHIGYPGLPAAVAALDQVAAFVGEVTDTPGISN